MIVLHVQEAHDLLQIWLLRGSQMKVGLADIVCFGKQKKEY